MKNSIKEPVDILISENSHTLVLSYFLAYNPSEVLSQCQIFSFLNSILVILHPKYIYDIFGEVLPMELGVVDFQTCYPNIVRLELSISFYFSLLLHLPVIWITRSRDFHLFFARWTTGGVTCFQIVSCTELDDGLRLRDELKNLRVSFLEYFRTINQPQSCLF